MLKKYSFIILLVASVLMISPVYSQNSTTETITKLENAIGLPHNGNITERLNELETTTFGKKYNNETINERCARLKKNLLDDSENNLDSELIKPINANQFEKIVNDGLTCYGDTCWQKNVVEYYDGENKMVINSKQLINQYGTEKTKKNLPDFLTFMNNEGDIDQMELGFIFDDTIDCGSIYMGDLQQINYPGMDKVRAIYSIDTQNGLEGDIFIRVYAIKGDQYIMLKTISSFSTHNDDTRVAKIYKDCLAAFNIQGDPSENCSFVECFKGDVQNNGKIQGALSFQAQSLIDSYAIK